MSFLSNHCRTISVSSRFFAKLRTISHSFPGISIHTPIIVWTVESWVFCVWIVWFILPRPQTGYTFFGHVNFHSFLAFFIPRQFRSFLAIFSAQIPLIPCIFYSPCSFKNLPLQPIAAHSYMAILVREGNSSKVLPLHPIAAHSYMAILISGLIHQKSSHCIPLQPTRTWQF